MDLLRDPVPSTLKRMTLPVVAGMVALMSFSLVDTYFVGLLGTEQLAAISFTFPVTFTLVSLLIGLGIGTAAVIGRLRGAGQMSGAQQTAGVAVYAGFLLLIVVALCCFSISDLLFSALGAKQSLKVYIHQYMAVWFAAVPLLAVPMIGNAVFRASGDTRSPSIFMGLGGLINVVLDPLLIFGWGPFPALGIQGAAWATAISWLIGAALVLVQLSRAGGLIHFTPAIRYWLPAVRQVWSIGLPAAGANIMTPVATGILTALVAGYGEAAVAAFGVGSRIESLAVMAVLALSMSLPPMISQNFGADLQHRVSHAYRVAVRFVLVWQLLIYLMLVLLSCVLAAWFSVEQSVAEMIRLFLFIVPLGYGFQGVIILTNSSFNAVHQPRTALLLSIARFFLFIVPFAWLGSYLGGLSWLFGAVVLANVAMAVVSWRCFARFMRAAGAPLGGSE